jgi:hypothetical protein
MSSATCSIRSSERHSSAAAAAILLATAGLSVAAGDTRADKPLVVAGKRLPGLCPIQRATGHRCPGCGMTRAFVLLWRGRIGEAIASNPASPFVFAAFVVLVFRQRPRSAAAR